MVAFADDVNGGSANTDSMAAEGTNPSSSSSSSSTAAAGPGQGDGPTASSCKLSDRLVLESLEAIPLGLKGLLCQVLVRMRSRAQQARLGLYWRVSVIGSTG